MVFTIAAVERDVGISKDVLRAWERRYGFPSPERDGNGDRIYPPEQVRRLRLVKRLTDQGHRPGRLLSWPIAELEEALAPQQDDFVPATADEQAATALQPVLDALVQHDTRGVQHLLQQRLAAEGLARFVQDTVAPLSDQVGLGWESGRLQVFEEHLFTECVTRVLRQAIASVPPGDAPRVLLTTVPHEPHGLGLLMAEAVMALAGAQCMSLGTQTPVPEIAHAAGAFKADVVALSFSSSFPRRQVAAVLQQLRSAIPPDVQVWAGGSGCARRVSLPDVRVMTTLDEAALAVGQWRAAVAGSNARG